MSIKGVQRGLRLPVSTLAISVASRPTVCPAASTTCHLRFSASPVPLGKYVDIDNSLWFERLKRERVEYRNGLKNVKLMATMTPLKPCRGSIRREALQPCCWRRASQRKFTQTGGAPTACCPD